MAVSEQLKNIRNKKYSVSESSEDDSAPRVIILTKEEQEKFGAYNKDGAVECKVSGTIDEKGKLSIQSISPVETKRDDSKDDMIEEVVQKVRPTIQPSPS